jgi:hypothetical protein
MTTDKYQALVGNFYCNMIGYDSIEVTDGWIKYQGNCFCIVLQIISSLCIGLRRRCHKR